MGDLSGATLSRRLGSSRLGAAAARGPKQKRDHIPNRPADHRCWRSRVGRLDRPLRKERRLLACSSARRIEGEDFRAIALTPCCCRMQPLTAKLSRAAHFSNSPAYGELEPESIQDANCWQVHWPTIIASRALWPELSLSLQGWRVYPIASSLGHALPRFGLREARSAKDRAEGVCRDDGTSSVKPSDRVG